MKQQMISLAALCTLLVPLCASAADNGELKAREQAAKQASAAFMEELKGELTSAMKEGGPANAIQVCTDKAPAIAGRLSRENGWRVVRVGTRVRNPMQGMPDTWEQQVLREFSSRHADGESFEKMSHSEVVEEPGGRYYRFMKAIPVGQPCLACHGPKEGIDAGVKQALQTRYPFDAATGYQAGELRGAVSIKQPLDVPLRDAPR